MSSLDLLNFNDPTFAFQHAMSHRNAMGVMSPLDRFSIIPYFIDPEQNVGTPGSMWHLDHQQAHNDALQHLPTEFGAATVGLFIGQNLRDYDLDNEGQLKWWLFQNWAEHYVGGNTISPNVPLPPPALQWTWPFW
jgi:hypothetical protein